MGDFSYDGRFFHTLGDFRLPWDIFSYHGRFFTTMGDFFLPWEILLKTLFDKEGF